MRYFYDTEFLEDGRTIELISIGIVAEDGREYYAVSGDAPWSRIRKNAWLMGYVVPSLPQPRGVWSLSAPKSWLVDFHNPLVKAKATIAEEVRDFLLCADAPELWADYCAYDHVVLCQLWGRMMDLPEGIPMFTHDIQHEYSSLGLGPNFPLPEQESGQHNALEDARHCKIRWQFLQQH